MKRWRDSPLRGPKFAKFWIPDDVVFVDTLPKTSTGKFLKSALREKFKDHVLPELRG